MPRFQGTDEQERALNAYVKLLRARNSVTAAAMQSLGNSDLTPTQFAVLEALYHSASEGTLCLGDIAEKILTSSGNLTLVVKNLERRGLAKRKPAANDRRYVGLEITPRGAKLMRQIFPAHVAAIVATIQRLSPAEQEQLAALCKKLGSAEAQSGSNK